MSADSSSSRSQPRRARSRSRKPRFQFNSKNEAYAVLAILENRVRNMGEETSRKNKLEKQLALLERSIEEQSNQMKERVRAAEEEMRGRLGLETEPGWGQIRKMKWGSETDEETSFSRTKTDRSGFSTTVRSSTSASSIERSEGTSVRERSEMEQLLKLPKRPNPALARYDEAIKHLEEVSAELKAIAVSTIREDDNLLVHGQEVRELAEKLKNSREKLAN